MSRIYNNSYKSIGRQTVQQKKTPKTHTSTSKINYKLKKTKEKIFNFTSNQENKH